MEEVEDIMDISRDGLAVDPAEWDVSIEGVQGEELGAASEEEEEEEEGQEEEEEAEEVFDSDDDDEDDDDDDETETDDEEEGGEADNGPPRSVNIVLGHDLNAAIQEMRDGHTAPTLCIISPSPRADRRMSDEDYLAFFRSMGEIMINLDRLEIHYYASDQVWMPARAMAAFLRNSPKMTYLLMNGMRVKGGAADMLELGDAFRLHPTLARMCFFNIQSLEPEVTPLNPMLELIVKSPIMMDLALRYTNWTCDSLGVIFNPESTLKTIRLTGKDTLGKEYQKLPVLLDSLKTNNVLTELRINQCPAPPGTGNLLALMLKKNKTLRNVLVEFQSYLDAVPVAKCMAFFNNTVSTLDMYTASKAVRRVQEERRQRAMQEMRTNGNNIEELQQNGVLGSIDMTQAEKEKEKKDIRVMRYACTKALERNTTLTTLTLNTSSISLLTPTMELFLKMNRLGCRQELLQNEDVTREEIFDFLSRHSDDHSLVWFLLRKKPALISLATDPKAPPLLPLKEAAAVASQFEAEPFIPANTAVVCGILQTDANRKRPATSAAIGDATSTRRTAGATLSGVVGALARARKRQATEAAATDDNGDTGASGGSASRPS